MMKNGISLAFNRTKTILEMIKFEHSVFALPFAYIGAVMAVKDIPALDRIFWITIAMVGARSFAMAVNRLVDKEIDALNPRTQNRALPRGLLRGKEVVLFTIVTFAVFILAVYQLAPLTRKLWPLVVIPFIIYPYTKRFTWGSHFILGFCLGLAPVGAWVALRNEVSLISVILGLAVLFWVAGFDIIYACQDVEIDRNQELHSIPAVFGIKRALQITAVCHTLTVFLLLLVGFLYAAGVLYFLGIVIAALLLVYENSLVSFNDLSRVNEAFFTTNGFISILTFIFTAADSWWRG